MRRRRIDTSNQLVLLFENFVVSQQNVQRSPDDTGKTTDKTEHEVDRLDGPLVDVLDTGLLVDDLDADLITDDVALL